jgi:transcriptional regulator with XRE-family HTH domain
MFLYNLKIKDVKIEMGLLVKALRKSERLSQQQLAEKLDLSRITIQNIESGKNFTIDTLLIVLEHFNQLNAFNEFIKNKIEENKQIKSLY